MKEDQDKNVFKKFRTNILLELPRDLFLYPNLKPVDIVLYQVIRILSYREGYCWATNETLMQSIHIKSKHTVIDSLRRLCDHHFIITKKAVSEGKERRLIYPIDNVHEAEIVNERRNLNTKNGKGEIIDKELVEQLLDYDWIHN